MTGPVTVSSPDPARPRRVVVVGAGPAGLTAAARLAAGGVSVSVLEAMPSPARKFLMAGRGGLNLTHSEPLDRFRSRYGPARARIDAWLDRFGPADLVAWAEGLGQPTFTGVSGRIFPKAMKASPLLRAWLAQLQALGVEIHLRRRWTGWDGDGVTADGPDGPERYPADVVVLAMGGASWPRLGSDGGWAGLLAARGVRIEPFRPANMGVTIPWSPAVPTRWAGAPLKNLRLTVGEHTARGEAVITRYGLEGGVIYALSAPLREASALTLDLKPDLTEDRLAARLAAAAPGDSLANRLRKAAGLTGPAAALLREAGPLPPDPAALAARIKALTLPVAGVQGLERAISSAGGLALDELDDRLMLRRLPGVFAAGEMLDWEAPTGGYLLQACFASGTVAADGVMAYLAEREGISR
jgi:uncharacterized flavoprotein (TIGR03862 family)